MSKLWGGRFSKPTNKLVEEFTNSIHFDQKLAKYDVIGSLCHIDILKKSRLISGTEHKRIAGVLNAILKTIENGSFKINPSYEDIHSYIQDLVEKKAGAAGLKLHTCRSRNDQVAFDTKLYCLKNIKETLKLLIYLQSSLKGIAQKGKGIYIPGYTHLQHAIPVALSDHFDAYCKMLLRDERRIFQAYTGITLTMGAGALAGTMIPAANYSLMKTLGLPFIIEASENSIDTVSDRDFVAEILSGLSILQMHLSRIAEDMVLWATKEFDFIDIDDAFCTGSSLMPQKKNPDVLELVRGYSGRLYGNLINVLTMMKGLPLSYNRDMQLDKEPLFDSFEVIKKELQVLTELFKNVSFKKKSIDKQLEDESLYATDLSDYLVQNKVSFKEAHKIIGKLIQHKYKTGTEIRAMSTEELKQFHPLLNFQIVNKIIDPEYSVKSKKSIKKAKR